jgi:hypothetical protein
MGFAFQDNTEKDVTSRLTNARIPPGWTVQKRRNKDSWTFRDEEGLKRVLIWGAGNKNAVMRTFFWTKNEARVKQSVEVVGKTVAALFDIEKRDREQHDKLRDELARAKKLLMERGIDTAALAEFEPKPAVYKISYHKRRLSEDHAYCDGLLHKQPHLTDVVENATTL